MSIRAYARFAVWDFLLCLCLAASLALTVCQGFNIVDELRDNVALVCGLTGVLVLVLVTAAYGRRTAVVGGVLFVVLALCLMGYGVAQTTQGVLAQDVEENALTFYLVIVLVSLVTVLLSRRKAGAVVLLVLGCLCCGVIQFLYLEWRITEFAVFVVVAGVNVMYRYYLASLRASQSARTAFAPVILTALLVMGVAGGVAAGVWFGVIAPLNPPAQQLILITEYKAKPEVEVQGSDTFYERLQDLLSNMQPETEMTTSETTDEGQQQAPDEGTEDLEDAEAAGRAGYDGTGVANAWQVTYQLVASLALVILAVVLLVALAVALKLRLRRRRLQRMCALPPLQQAVAFYRFYLGRLDRVGVKRAVQDTPREFAEHAHAALTVFDSEGEGVTFAQLTTVYERAAFGHLEPSTQDLARLARYYPGFYRGCRAYAGTRAYLLRFFVL